MQLHHAFIASVLALSTAAAPAATGVDTAERPSNWVAPAYFAPEANAVRTTAGRQALAAAPSALPFVAVTPCRLVDTRGNGAPLTGGFIPAATLRTYTLVGPLRHPRGGEGDLAERDGRQSRRPRLPDDVRPGRSVPLRLDAQLPRGDVVANAAVVPLSPSGSISVAFGVSGGDLVIDTNGYFAPLGVVNSLNGQGGDLTLAPGANVTLTPGGSTLTISAASGTGPTGPTAPWVPRVRRASPDSRARRALRRNRFRGRDGRCGRDGRAGTPGLNGERCAGATGPTGRPAHGSHRNVRHAVRALVHGLGAAPQLPARSDRRSTTASRSRPFNVPSQPSRLRGPRNSVTNHPRGDCPQGRVGHGADVQLGEAFRTIRR